MGFFGYKQMEKNQTATQADSTQIKWVRPPKSPVKGSDIEFIGYRFGDYPLLFENDENGRKCLTWLLKEIEAVKASDIYISPYTPLLVQLKGIGLRSATQRTLSYDEAQKLVFLLTNGDNSLFSLIAGQRALSGSTQISLSTGRVQNLSANILQDDGRSTTLDVGNILNKVSQKSLFRYQLSGSLSPHESNGFLFVLRPLEQMPKAYHELGIEKGFVDSFLQPYGICIIAGATGQGKSTTLSAEIRYILEHDTIIKGAIVELADPIEMRYDKILSSHSQVWQKQIGSDDTSGHLKSFNDGIKSAMRESPRLIVVGELRDRESIASAIEASLTGHTVYATTHASDIGSIMPRLISQVPTDKIADLLSSIQVLSAQRLFRDINGNVRTMREWLVFTPALKNALFNYVDDPKALIAIIRTIVENNDFGVVSFVTQAEQLLKDGVITESTYQSLCVKENLSLDDLKRLESYSAKKN